MAKNLFKIAKQKKIKYFLISFVDLFGVLRSKLVPANAIKEFKAGKLEFRADKAGIVHVRFGKASFTKEALFDNLKTLQESIDKNKPSGAKGKYWKTFYVTSTMGPSVQIDINAVQDYQPEG